jgi:serine/threonine protein kinase
MPMNADGIGSEVAGYRIESIIGRGGMAVVYRAEDTRLGRKVALKVLAPALSDEERFQQRFVQESRLAASLDHPNIIPIYEAGNADGRLFIAMRYVVGHDMKVALAANSPMGPSRTLRLFEQIGDALDAAHERGLVHRDVKPGNVLLTSFHENDDHVYLTDFGLTKRASSLTGGLTGTGHFLGTIDYVAPEQIAGKQVDARTDIYALGCVLYECLTGRVPFPRDDDAATLWAHLVDVPPPVSAARTDTSPSVDAVVAKALAKAPQDRYSSCHELVGDLRAALTAAQVHGRRPTGGGVDTAAPRSGSALERSAQRPDSQDVRDPAEHPSFPPGTFPPGMVAPPAPHPRPARPAAHRAWEPDDEDDLVHEVTEQEPNDPAVEQWLEPDDPAVEQWPEDEAPEEHYEEDQRLPGRRSAREFARDHRWAIVAALVAVAGLVTAGAFFILRPGNGSPTRFAHYTSGAQFQSLPTFTLDAPSSWTAHNSGNTDVVLTPGGNAAASLFTSGDTSAAAALLRTAPAQVIGVWIYETNVSFSQTSWQDVQRDVSNQLQLPFSFDNGWQQGSVGGLPSDRITGRLSTSSGESVRFVMDVVQRPSTALSTIAVFFAAPNAFQSQQHLFDQVRHSIVFP